MKSIKLAITLMLTGAMLLAVAGCGTAAAADFLVLKKNPAAVERAALYDDKLEADTDRVLAKVDAFSADLLTSLPRDASITSPMSLYMALLNLRLGITGGETANKLDALMRPEGMNDDDYMAAIRELVARYADTSEKEVRVEMSQLVVAAEDPDITWNDAYLKRVEPLLTDAGSLDFTKQKQAMKSLNSWADERTNGLIPQIFKSPDEVDPETRMMILNAIYFNGKWEKEFDNRPLRDMFKGTDGESEIDFMQVTNDFLYGEIDGVQIVNIPYLGGADMQVALGPEDMPLEQVADILFAQPQDTLNLREGYLLMPTFELESQMTLNDTLKSMGLEAMFVDLGPNDFFEQPRDLKIAQAIQNVFIKVDRKGTEAAAVTRLETKNAAMMPPEENEPFEMIVNRPFVFRVAYQGMTLFAGIIKNL